ncbi:hypothetical protein [Streptomyces sp. CB03911]|uniref:hypothetical protein n=1 Tax=Streptomyces sp. CB03911 TaxID=1804758 RepID=UPI00093FBF08|nr:hypothetical protein [Streptomyces sp. CB03911]OKI25642.1 hypothetical protein A6A07_30745 [Streptomyces sp. CB03911]
MGTERPVGPDAHYLTMTAEAYGWETLRGGEGLVLRRGPWAVRAQFAPSGAFVIAVGSGPDGSPGQMSMPQALEILETRGAPPHSP